MKTGEKKFASIRKREKCPGTLIVFRA